jgi:hypothetical protein
MDRRDPRHERRAAQPHHRAEHPDSRHLAEHSGERHGAETAKRKPAKSTPTKPQERSAFMLGHAGRQVRIGPVAFWTVVGTLVIMAGWSVTTATYFAFQDDVLARMEMQSAYEDRIAEMRAQVDRVTSRHMLEQEQLEQKIEQIVHRQSQLEQRATSLGTVTDPATGSVRTPRGQSSTTKASPISVPAPARAPSDARADAGGFMLASVTPVQRPPLETVMARVEASLDPMEGRQVNTLASLEETYDAKARRMRAVLTEVGIDTGKHVEPATGGPFVSYRLSANASAFEKQVYRINLARAPAGRDRHDVELRRTHRPIPVAPGDAHRHRLPRRHRRGDPRHRRRHGCVRRMERRLWPHGRGRSRQRPRDALRPSLGDRRAGRADGQGRPDRRAHGLDRTLYRAASTL